MPLAPSPSASICIVIGMKAGRGRCRCGRSVRSRQIIRRAEVPLTALSKVPCNSPGEAGRVTSWAQTALLASSQRHRCCADPHAGSNRKTRAAAAGGGGVGIVDLESLADQVVGEIDFRALPGNPATPDRSAPWRRFFPPPGLRRAGHRPGRNCTENRNSRRRSPPPARPRAGFPPSESPRSAGRRGRKW